MPLSTSGCLNWKPAASSFFGVARCPPSNCVLFHVTRQAQNNFSDCIIRKVCVCVCVCVCVFVCARAGPELYLGGEGEQHLLDCKACVCLALCVCVPLCLCAGARVNLNLMRARGHVDAFVRG
jgi:hypothetical protein